jgi:hypothetical protein
MQELSNKVADPNKLIVEQLSPQDRERFEAVYRRLAFLMVISRIEEEHYRYSRIIEKIWQVAQARYNQEHDTNDRNGDYNYQSLLDLIRAQFPTNPQILDEVVRPQGPTCTIEAALFLSEGEALRQLPQSYKLSSAATRDVNMIRSRHHLSPDATIDDDILSTAEQATVRRWRAILPELQVTMARTLVFIADIEHLKGLATASEAIYQRDERDWIKSGGDPAAIVQRHPNDLKMRAMFAMWDIIADRAPTAEQLRELDRNTSASQK